MAILQTDFKTAMATKLGGGGVFSASNIVIDSILAGSVEVNFHVEVNKPAIPHVELSPRLCKVHLQMLASRVHRFRRRHQAPETVQTQAASMLTTLASSTDTIDIVVGGTSVSASAISAPVVTKTVVAVAPAPESVGDAPSTNGTVSRRRDCHSAAPPHTHTHPPSTFSRCFNRRGERLSAE